MGGQLHAMYIIGGSCRSCGASLALAGDGRGRAICAACLRAVDADIAQKRTILLPAERTADLLTALA
jgi:hypothetical protein